MKNVKRDKKKAINIKNEAPKNDNRMVICGDNSVISYQIARYPRFTERV